jgi:tetratricopeptide (TPR) repeat protein
MGFGLISLFYFASLVVAGNHLTQECLQAYDSSDYQKALRVCEENLSRQTPEESAEIIIKLLSITNKLDMEDKKRDYLRQLSELPTFSQSNKPRYVWNRWQGKISYFAKDLDQSRDYFLEALSIAMIAENHIWLSDSYNDLGVVANKAKDFNRALKYYVKSLAISKQQEDLFLVGVTYNNIAAVYQQLEDFESAEQYYNFALDSYRLHQNSKDYDKNVEHRINHTTESLLKLSLLHEDIDKAQKYAQDILNELPKTLTGLEKIRSRVNFARFYLKKGEIELVDYFLSIALKFSNESNGLLMYEIKYLYAKLFQQQGKINQAISHATEGVALLDELDYIHLTKYYKLLSELFENTQASKALQYSRLYQDSREKVLSQKYNSDITTIQHQIEKKQIENELNLERLDRISSELKITSLNNRFLLIIIVLILLTTWLLTIYFIKKRQANYLLEKIKNHKQQLLLMDEKMTSQVSVDGAQVTSANKDSFCRQLVVTMTDAINIWEQHTNSNRIELADKSGIWTISNDDGTLRTRSLDKYLSIDKIPKNPRWRYVVRTCHFILSDSQLSQKDREVLEQHLSSILLIFQNMAPE